MTSKEIEEIEKQLDISIGKLLGCGISRRVYEIKDQDLVLKIEDPDSKDWQNIIEYKVSRELQYWKSTDKYIARCPWISSDGILLIQKKCRDLTREEEKQLRKKKFPSFLTDFKPSNFGILNGEIVSRDYGSSIITSDMVMRDIPEEELEDL